MRNGWVKLHRQSLDSRVFQNAELWRLWCWILLRANHSESWADENTQVQAGQLLIGRQSLAEALGWKPSTAWERLLKLEQWEMISLKSDSRGTLLTVCHWKTYQDCEQEIRQPSDSEATASRQPADSQPTLIKNEKKYKKEKKEKKKEPDLSALDFPPGFDTPETRKALTEWIAYRKEIKKPFTRTMLQASLKKFAPFGPQAMQQAITDAISAGWQGFFTPKGNPAHGTGKAEKRNVSKPDENDTLSQFARLRDRATPPPSRNGRGELGRGG